MGLYSADWWTVRGYHYPTYRGAGVLRKESRQGGTELSERKRQKATGYEGVRRILPRTYGKAGGVRKDAL